MNDKVNSSEFFRTSGVEDFKLKNENNAPKDYPHKRVEDEYSKHVFAGTFDERKKEFVKYVLQNPATDTVKGFFYELIRINEGQSNYHEGKILAAIDYINSRKDCADFVVAGMLRLYYQLIESPLLTDEIKLKAKDALLNFKYWPDEPGIDSMCYWTENHHIIFSSNELLAGQLFPDEVFGNSNMIGTEKIERAKKRINKWLELRFYTGFNEWLSNVYFDEDLPALTNLLDFSYDEQITKKAKIIMDTMFLDMASNSYYGLFTCTHGRTYTKEKLYPYRESTIDTAKLVFGMGRFANEDNMSAVLLAMSSNYQIPKAIFEIAKDTQRDEWINKQRVSIKFKDAKKWGYGKMDTESAMGLLSFGGYCHHRTFNHMILMLDEFNWWDNDFFMEFRPFKKAIQIGKKIKLTNLVALLLRKDLSRNAFEEANIYTYRTPDYMLSTAQDYRKSYGGDQHHIWQATLDGEAICFTTHPGGYGTTAPDAYWHGNGFMPKSVQYKNVNITIYNTPKTPTILLSETLEFTHAFFPKERYDVVKEKGGWIFGKKNDGYIALYSLKPYSWQSEGEYKDMEVIAKGKRNIWITEMGRKDVDKSFEDFMNRILKSDVKINGLNVTYNNLSIGSISAGWNKGLKVNGKSISIKDYKRYDNPACSAEFESSQIEIAYMDAKRLLRFCED